MTHTDIETAIVGWIDTTNTHDVTAYLAHFAEEAVLDDPSVGETFAGHEAIADYYERYFVGYNTTTRIVRIEPTDDLVHVVVDFRGNFPGGQTNGVFDVRLSAGKITFVHANLE